MEYKFLKKWDSLDPATGTQNYFGNDCSNYFLVYTKTRDSELLSQSNFDCILDDLRKNFPDCNDFLSVLYFRHWACGNYEQIAIRDDAPQTLLDHAENILKQLNDYPVFDDEHYSDLQCVNAQKMFDEIKNDIENEMKYADEFKGWDDEKLFDYCFDQVF